MEIISRFMWQSGTEYGMMSTEQKQDRRCDMRDLDAISGKSAFAFANRFDYVRESGTAAEADAAREICAQIRALGLEPREEQFSFETYEVDRAELRVTAPYEKSYPVRAYGDCADTPTGGLTAPLVYVENGDRVSLTRVKGAVALICGRVREDICRRLQEAGAVGFVSICGTPLEGPEDRLKLDYDLRGPAKGTMPGLYIHYDDAREMVERGAAVVHMTAEQRRVIRQSENVLVHIPGRDLPEQVIALSAHYDSVPAGPGAYDNIAGVAIVWEVLRWFAAHPPRRTLECIFFGAEERGLCGSRDFVQRHGGSLDRYVIDLNVDLAGQTVGGTVLGVTADRSVCDTLEELLDRSGIGASIENKVWASDSNTFAVNGVPALTIDRDGFGMHTRHDTVALLSPWALERDARLLAYLAASLDEMDEMPFRREIPDAMGETLRAYFGGDPPTAK